MNCEHKLKGRCKSCSNRDRKGKYKWSDKARKGRMNKNNPMWKGVEVQYHALHAWVKRHKIKTKFCENCGKKEPYDLANISGNYIRCVEDFKWLCRGCHMKEDGRIDNLKLSHKKYG